MKVKRVVAFVLFLSMFVFRSNVFVSGRESEVEKNIKLIKAASNEKIKQELLAYGLVVVGNFSINAFVKSSKNIVSRSLLNSVYYSLLTYFLLGTVGGTVYCTKKCIEFIGMFIKPDAKYDEANDFVGYVNNLNRLKSQGKSSTEEFISYFIAVYIYMSRTFNEKFLSHFIKFCIYDGILDEKNIDKISKVLKIFTLRNDFSFHFSRVMSLTGNLYDVFDVIKLFLTSELFASYDFLYKEEVSEEDYKNLKDKLTDDYEELRALLFTDVKKGVHKKDVDVDVDKEDMDKLVDNLDPIFMDKIFDSFELNVVKKFNFITTKMKRYVCSFAPNPAVYAEIK
ncbi:MAG: hypothetical protein FWC41_07485 [Firmicutes bacterium]|nr:hypothetical protein [Bacillota bacterium]